MAVRVKGRGRVRVGVRVLAFFTTFFAPAPAFLVAVVFGFLAPPPVAVFLGACACVSE